MALRFLKDTKIKPALEIIAAGVVLLVVVLLVREPDDRSRPPTAISSFSKFVRESVPPVHLQQWATNVVAQSDQATNPAPIDVPVPSEINWRIPALCLSWKAQILKPQGTKWIECRRVTFPQSRRWVRHCRRAAVLHAFL
jgi:hypothetical protein